MKRAFFLFYTVVFMVVVAIIGAIVMEFGAGFIKNVRDDFFDEKADVLIFSSIEYAKYLLKNKKIDFCKTNSLTIKYPDFIAILRFKFFTKTCKNNRCFCIDTNESNNTVLIYLELRSKNKSLHIRKTLITLQKF